MPAKHAVSLNPEVLPETTLEETALSYVDIAALEGGDAAASLSPKELTFGTAPSRARRVLRAGDTILSTVRTYLKAVANFPEASDGLVASTGFAVFRPNGRLHPRFAYWAALSEPFIENVVAHSEGVSYPAINPSVLGSLHMPMPPRLDQERIANFLDVQTARIDALIAEKEALIARLQEWRQAWLSAELFQEAKYRETRLKFCLRGSLQYGATESGDPSAAGPRYIRITDIRMDGTLTDEDAKYLTEEQATSYLLEDEDVLFARSGATVGKSFVYLKEMGRCAYAGYLIRAKLDKTLLLPRYLRLLTETHQYWAYLRGAETQSTIQNASAEKYANFAFPLPPVSVQKEVVDRLDVQLNKVEHLVSHAIAHTKRLSEYRSSLISAAVTGQLDLSTFKKAVQ